MPMVTIERNQEADVMEFNVCLTGGCIEYREDAEWIYFSSNESVKGGENGVVKDVDIDKEIKLKKRQNYKEVADRLINDDVPKFNEANIPESVKDIFDAYKFFIDQCMKNRRYVGVKLEWTTPKLIYVYIRFKCEEGRNGLRVIVNLEAEKIGEHLKYYYDAVAVDPVGIAKKEIWRVMGLFALFAEYVSQPAQEESKEAGQGQGGGQSQQEGQAGS